ncbi:hypothetical protein [Streptomyces sp. NPDC046939]|uniref:hypothetical protein n=1 Tax=Streptomyces sp. NPDC046939 TaxID=3155376 RepID=UPI0033FE30A3
MGQFLGRAMRGDWAGAAQAALWPVGLLVVAAFALAIPSYGQDPDDVVLGFADRMRVALAVLLQGLGGSLEVSGRGSGGSMYGGGYDSGSAGTASLSVIPLLVTVVWIVALVIGVRMLRTRLYARTVPGAPGGASAGLEAAVRVALLVTGATLVLALIGQPDIREASLHTAPFLTALWTLLLAFAVAGGVLHGDDLKYRIAGARPGVRMSVRAFGTAVRAMGWVLLIAAVLGWIGLAIFGDDGSSNPSDLADSSDFDGSDAAALGVFFMLLPNLALGVLGLSWGAPLQFEGRGSSSLGGGRYEKESFGLSRLGDELGSGAVVYALAIGLVCALVVGVLTARRSLDRREQFLSAALFFGLFLLLAGVGGIGAEFAGDLDFFGSGAGRVDLGVSVPDALLFGLLWIAAATFLTPYLLQLTGMPTAIAQTPLPAMLGQTPLPGALGQTPLPGALGRTPLPGVPGQAPHAGAPGQGPLLGVPGQASLPGVSGQTPAPAMPDQSPTAGQSPLEGQQPMAGQSSKADQPPTSDQSPEAGQWPTPSQSATGDRLLTPDQLSAPGQAPMADQSPTPDQSPVAGQSPAPDQSSTANHPSAPGQTPTADQTPPSPAPSDTPPAAPPTAPSETPPASPSATPSETPPAPLDQLPTADQTLLPAAQAPAPGAPAQPPAPGVPAQPLSLSKPDGAETSTPYTPTVVPLGHSHTPGPYQLTPHPTPVAPTGDSPSRRVGVWVGTIVGAIVIGGGAAAGVLLLMDNGGGDKQDGKGGEPVPTQSQSQDQGQSQGQTQTPPGPASSTPSPTPTPTDSPTPSVLASDAAPTGMPDVPAGYHQVFDEKGFSFVIPDVWDRVGMRNGSQITYAGSTGMEKYVIGVIRNAPYTSHENLLAMEKHLEEDSKKSNYQRIRLETNTFQGREGALWEYTYENEAGQTIHGIDQSYITPDGTEYTIFLTGKEDLWTDLAGTYQVGLDSWRLTDID